MHKTTHSDVINDKLTPAVNLKYIVEHLEGKQVPIHECISCLYSIASSDLILLAKMADYHTVYKANEGETTEWDEIQRKLGNLPPKVRF